ncbi:pre-mRNA processing RNA-helicase [Sporothrix epigloea]|uniref:RNA helicase n=1 Tax=Sporothrix epigloea TaxID=1892477 RepID=A0ABP0DAY8_9PEZI
MARHRTSRSPSPAGHHDAKRARKDDDKRDRARDRRDTTRDNRRRSRSPVDVRKIILSSGGRAQNSNDVKTQHRYRDREYTRHRERDHDRGNYRRNRSPGRDRRRDIEWRGGESPNRRRRTSRSRSRSPASRRRDRSRDVGRENRGHRQGRRESTAEVTPAATADRNLKRDTGDSVSSGIAGSATSTAGTAAVVPEKSEAEKKADRLAKLEAWKKKLEQKNRKDGGAEASASLSPAPSAATSPPQGPTTTKTTTTDLRSTDVVYAGKFDPKAIAKKSAARHHSPGLLGSVALGKTAAVPDVKTSALFDAKNATSKAPSLSASKLFSSFGFNKGAADSAAGKRKLDLDDEETSKRKLAKLPDASLEDADHTSYDNQDEDEDDDDGHFDGTEEEFAAAARAARERRDERIMQQNMAMQMDELVETEGAATEAPVVDADEEASAAVSVASSQTMAEPPSDTSAKVEPVAMDIDEIKSAVVIPEPKPAETRRVAQVSTTAAATPAPDLDMDNDADPLDAFMANLDQASSVKKTLKTKKPSTEPEAYFNDDEDYSTKVQDSLDAKSILSIAAKRKKKEIPTIDYSKLDITPVRKNFWVEPSELSQLTEAEVAELRLDLDGIKVSGKDVPKPVQKWSHCGLTRTMLEVVEKLGYDRPTPIQMQALPVIMSGRDVIGVAKTGSGKTMAFLVPMFRHIMDQDRVKDNEGPIGLILTPTRELAVQIHRDCKPFAKALGLRTVCAYGGPPIKDQIAELKRGADLIVATTGRMIDLLAANQGRVVSLKRTTYIVLDEADRMFDMGFEPQVMKIFANIRPDRQTVLFSATMPRIIDALVKKVLKTPIEIVIGGRSVVAPEITQMIEVREEKEKFFRLLELLGELYIDDDDVRSLIFVERQEKADELLRELLRKGYACMSLHGGKDQVDRDSTISDFKCGVCPVLVATSVAARGLDVKQLKLVVNYDAPNHLEDYVHRAGRTGRAGNTGTAVTFITPEQENCAPGIAKALEQSGQPVPERLAEMRKAWREKVKAGQVRDQSGFGGKGLEKLDKDREAARMRERKTHKAEGDDEEPDKEAAAEEDKKKKAADNLAQSAASAIVSRDTSKGEGNAGGDASAASTTSAAGTPAQSASLPPKPAGTGGGAALEKAASAINDINARLARAGQLRPGQPIDNKGPDAGAFHATLEINDFPQKARWAVTNRTNVAKILDSTGTSITTKGTFYAAGAKVPPGGEAKLYLLIEGDTELAVGNALTELTRLLREGTVAAADADSRAPASGRYTIT